MFNWYNHITYTYQFSQSITFNLFAAEKTLNAVTANIPNHGSSSSKYVSFMLYSYAMLPKTGWFLSDTALEFVFPDEIGLAVIPYYSSIRGFLNS